MSRFGVAAGHIATWDAHIRRAPLPPGFDADDAWAERHGQPERVPEALAELAGLRRADGSDRVMALLGDREFGRTEGLIASTGRRIAALARFPRSLLHHDLVRSNLFALADGSTAAIDWENVGRGPMGVDLAPLVIGSVRRGEASGEDLAAIEDACLRAYVAGLRAAGIDADPGVQAGYRLALGLRWHVVLGTIRTALDPAATRLRGSRPEEPWDEGLRHFVAVARRILDAGHTHPG